MRRGTGGLVTALTGLASHRRAVWIASAMTDGRRAQGRAGGRPRRSPSARRSGGEYDVRLVASEEVAYDRFYNVFANPMLWFIQHYLWDLSNAPDIRRNEIEAFEYGYNVVNEDLAHAVIEEIADHPRAGRDGPRLPPVHAAGARAPGAAGRLPAPLHPHPVDAVGRVARAARAHPRRALPRAARQRHRRLPHARLPAQLPAVLPRPARRSTSTSSAASSATTGARSGCAATRCRSTQPRRARSPRRRARREFEAELPAPPPRAPDPARRPRRPLEERPARLHRASTCSSSSTPSSASA